MSIVLTRILAFVPKNEHFDPALATVNEGTYLTEAHLQNVEDALAGNESLNEMITEKDGQVTQLQGEVESLETAVADKDARIMQLEQEVAILGKQPSGAGSAVLAGSDESADTAPTPSYLSDESPINRYADKEIRHRERFK